ncbi:ubiquinol-cytochrome-c reductase complex assembly factor 2 [Condylostylus longicornis]|uniref:ubiquinol-cytochrome-c reductase complex assembly factor 2 n=1 Tax=Condylostylus longicornis TaxID=2530218 RepID=UPI00244DB9AA|nr:ubiquinol-cytochrome-c reductase complex assembly factor 2 [Condylostylus longicornis]XP_055387577.1 ubiquinol-cytochrome-c reductase complex assembly factor 2 [Condylostylus longicornis]
MPTNYQRYIKILEKWPIDKTKPGRDLAERIRQHLQILADPTVVPKESLSFYKNQLDSLERLSKNTYGNKYKRIYNSSATGLDASQCKQVLSSDFLKLMNEEKGIFSK